jgi:hypothetical protein
MVMTNNRLKERVYEYFLLRIICMLGCRITQGCNSEGDSMNVSRYDSLKSHVHFCLMLIIKQVVYLHAHASECRTGYV